MPARRTAIVLLALLVLGVAIPLVLTHVGGGSPGIRTQQSFTTRAP